MLKVRYVNATLLFKRRATRTEGILSATGSVNYSALKHTFDLFFILPVCTMFALTFVPQKRAAYNHSRKREPTTFKKGN